MTYTNVSAEVWLTSVLQIIPRALDVCLHVLPVLKASLSSTGGLASVPQRKHPHGVWDQELTENTLLYSKPSPSAAC